MLDYLIYGAILFVPVMIILTITGFWRAFPLILLLTGLSFIAFKWTDDNYGRPLAKIAAVVVPLAIVASASWRPAASKFRLWVADGVVRAGMCAKWIGVGGSVATLAMARLNVVMWLRWCWWMGAIALVGLAVERVMHRIVAASVREEPGAVERLLWLDELDAR